VLAVALGAAVVLAACGTAQPLGGAAGAPAPGTAPRAISAATAPRSPSAPSQPAPLSPQQLAGQRIIYSYEGVTPPASLLARIRRGEAAGVIFFAPNIANRSQLRIAVSELEGANRASPIHAPLLLMIDQEGGLVRRLNGAPEDSEKMIGKSPRGLALARDAGAGAAINLSSAGLNVNLAPVLDVFDQAGNFIDQYERSYGNSATWVAALGGAFIRSQQGRGVAATAKHFPGLGSAALTQDTDEGPVTLDRSLRTVREVDERPYRTAIAAGVSLVMMSWATYPALDRTLPAGLSPIVVGDELRRHLGFAGVTITDSLEAGALRAYGGPAERARLAVRAGEDLILSSGRNVNADSPSIGVHALNGIASGIVGHEISRSSAEQAAVAIIALRRTL
jgi:beta-N-acetylhexosaminidase